MTLQQCASWLIQTLRFKINETQVNTILDMVQKLVFDEDSQMLLYRENTLTPYVQLNYATSLQDPAASDIGRPVEGRTSGATGVLVGYDNDEGYVYISGRSGTFEAGENVYNTDGDGFEVTLESSDFQVGYKGPYDFPTDPAVRKMVGITTVTDARIFGVDMLPTSDDLDDYGMDFGDYDDRKLYVPSRLDFLRETITLIQSPNIDGDYTYRWVYYQLPPTISDFTASAQQSYLWIPLRYRMNYVQACAKCAKISIEDGKVFTREDVLQHFGSDFWTWLKQVYTPQGKNSTQTNKGCVEVQL